MSIHSVPVNTPLVILSPHRDDAAFSASRLLLEAARAGLPTTLLNVFTRSTYAPFQSAVRALDDVSRLRLAEDQHVQALVGPSLLIRDLDLLDAPLRLDLAETSVLGSPLTPERFAQEVARTARALPSFPALSLFALPLAIGGHIDHQIARDAARAAISSQHLLFYQDLPYASRISAAELATETTSILAMLHLGLAPYLFRSPAAASDKQLLSSCYPSQIAPETISEMTDWTATHSGELFFTTTEAAQTLRRLLPDADLHALSEFAA